jgi:CrcB protein
MEAFQLVERGEMLRMGLYILLSVGLGFLGAFLGVYLARNL